MYIYIIKLKVIINNLINFNYTFNCFNNTFIIFIKI